MSPETKNEIETLKRKVSFLEQKLQENQQQQIKVPLDEASIEVIIKALYNKRIDRLTVKDLRYVTLTAVS